MSGKLGSATIYAEHAATGWEEPTVVLIDLDDYTFTGLPNPRESTL